MTWHVVRTEVQKERGACAFLRRVPVEPFAPMFRKDVIIRNNIVARREMMFPGYVFIQVSEMTLVIWSRVNSTPGVQHVMLGVGGTRPAVIDQLIMDVIRKHTVDDDEVPVKGEVDFEERQPVVVVTGPLSGIDALFHMNADGRCGVLAKLFAREQWLPVPRQWLKTA